MLLDGTYILLTGTYLLLDGAYISTYISLNGINISTYILLDGTYILLDCTQSCLAEQVSVMGSCFYLHATTFLLCQGLSIAATTRVANQLGDGRPNAARRSFWMAAVMSSALMFTILCPLIYWRERVAMFFSHDEEVVKGEQCFCFQT